MPSRSEGMGGRVSTGLGALACMAAVVLLGCQGHPTTPAIPSPLGPIRAVPGDVQRIAVLFPRPSNPDFAEAYQRLENAAFQLRDTRATIRIIDRFNLSILRSEQRFQQAGSVTDESAVRIGGLLGVDSVLLYTIEGPTARERLFASRPSQLRPITVTTKIVRVETAEVVYHNVVTARMDADARWEWALVESMDMQQLGRDALDRGIRQTVLDLHRAFQ